MKRKLTYLAACLVLVGCGKKQSGLPEASTDFAVQTVQYTSAETNTAYPATFKGQQDTEIRPKISGYITRVAVKEGDVVKAGQVLFQIDSEQYRSAVQQAQAQINVVRSNIATQELTVKNRQMLHDKGITSDYDLQSARNSLESLKAQLASAQATLASAQDNLRYCTITSPSNGVVGQIPYRVGSLVSASSTEALTTVANISTVYVYFSMTEKDILALSKENGNLNAAIAKMPAVGLMLADGTEYDLKGKISALSGVIDPTTGAVSMRADFANPRGILRSGGSGNILFPTQEQRAIIVPQAASYEVQDKKFVYVVGGGNVVAPREITVLSQNDGKNYIVTAGLSGGEKIVVEGISSLKSGMKINPITPEQSAKNKAKAAQDLKEGKM